MVRIQTLSNLRLEENVTETLRSPIIGQNYAYPGTPRYASSLDTYESEEIVLIPREVIIRLNDNITQFQANMDSTLSEIPLEQIIIRVQNSATLNNPQYVEYHLRAVNRVLTDRIQHIRHDNYLNFRYFVNQARDSNTHDLGLTSFFEMMGQELINMLENIFSDPILMGGLGVYIIVLTFERLLTRIVIRPGLTTRRLITIVRGSLNNSIRRFSNNSLLARNFFFDTLQRGYLLFLASGRAFLRIYYTNGSFQYRFYHDITVITLITTGINRFRSIRF